MRIALLVNQFELQNPPRTPPSPSPSPPTLTRRSNQDLEDLFSNPFPRESELFAFKQLHI